MKNRILGMTLAVTMLLSVAITACGGNKEKDKEQTTTQVSSSTSAEAKLTYQEWEDSWEKSPNAETMTSTWKDLKKMTPEYIFRTTPDNVERTMEGNLYLQGWPIVKDQVTLKVLVRQSPNIEDIESNYEITNLEKKTNVKIDWILGPNDDTAFLEKRNVLIASGDIPDIIAGAWTKKSEDITLGMEQKIFIPLNDLIEKYGDNIKKAFELRPDMKKVAMAPDGNIYSFYGAYYNYNMLYPAKGFINTAWLKKLNLNMPTTVDEYEAVLKAFKTQDPNGNGKPDEVPLVGTSKGWNSDIEGFFMNPFILNNMEGSGKADNAHFVVENGTVSFAPARDEYKDGLKWLKKLYDQKLFSADSFVMNGDQMTAMNSADTIVGSYSCGWVGGAVNYDTKNPQLKEYDVMPPLKGPSGNGYAYYQPVQTLEGMANITKNCKTPEVAMRWIDWWYSPESYIATFYGRLGEDWEYATAGENGELGMQALLKDKAGLESKPNNILAAGIFMPYFSGTKEVSGMKSVVAGNDYNSDICIKANKEYYDGKMMNEFLPKSLSIQAEESKELELTWSPLVDYVSECNVKFITGKMSLENDWVGYVEKLNKMGLPRIIEIKQKSYDTYKNSK